MSTSPTRPLRRPTGAAHNAEPVDTQEDDLAWRARVQRAAQQPWREGFIALMRYVSAKQSQHPPMGSAHRPQHEALRLGQAPTVVFAPREIAQIEADREHPLIRLFGLGMLGPNGPLPIHFTEIVKDRQDNQNDPTLAHFLDLFHHRYLSLIYRAWAQGQASAGMDRADDEQFSRYVAWLSGNDPHEIAHSALQPHARLAAAPHTVRQARNPEGLAATLRRYFGVGVQVREYMLNWIEIEQHERTRMGMATATSLLGQGAIAGDMVPDRQHMFRLVIGPLSLQQYLRLTPTGEDLPVLVEWVRNFIGFEMAWEIELQVAPKAAPPARMGEHEQLGWSTWLGQADEERAITGMVFQPEHYSRSLKQVRTAAQHRSVPHRPPSTPTPHL